MKGYSHILILSAALLYLGGCDSGDGTDENISEEVSTPSSTSVLKKTGQTKSYDAYGNEVTDGSIKDDGYYQKGVDPSYTRDDATEIVTDHITGLQWQDNADVETVKKQWLTDANYNTCDNNHSDPACYDTSGDTAATYCSNLTLGGHTDWRLPTQKELMYIADRSKRDPAIDTTAFTHVVSDFYWSSTTIVGEEYFAWGVFFDVGMNGGYVWYTKSSSHYVRCVRGGQP